MKLQPCLIKVLMSMACSGGVSSIIRKNIRVELWEGVGLAIHEYDDEMNGKWRISHMQSGKAVLRHMKSRDETIEYLLKIYEWKSSKLFQVNWKMTPEELEKLHFKEEVKAMLNGFQKQISGERR